MKMRKGFSLIEIGIVMVVIGILMAAVMKGKDIIKSAEIKQMNQTFLSKWVNVAASYYDRVGYNLTGGTTSRSMGVAEGFTEDGNTTVWGCYELVEATKRAGINIENIISTNTGSPCRATISGEFTDDITVAVGLESFSITSDDENATRNFVLFFNMPGDVAQAFDRLVDGQADLSSGSVVALAVYEDTSPMASGDIIDDNLSSDEGISASATGLNALTGEIDAEKLYTIGVILDH
ncbi:MAG: prepilin-type N-terminal cleavage/methylation domain-containing protein [Arcobacteraceae bacterium]|nr:prepilin-type N-terminal cleavage/methylation domain-containing protein [Arcobacteraceae bacterium]